MEYINIKTLIEIGCFNNAYIYMFSTIISAFYFYLFVFRNITRHFNYIYLFFTIIFVSDLNDMKKVRFMEASEQTIRNELAKVREENQRLIKKDEENQSLIKSLHEDFKSAREDIKATLEIKEKNKELVDEIARLRLESGRGTSGNLAELRQKLADHKLTETRLRATMELMSTQLVQEDVKNKQLIAGLNEMTRQIEDKGKNEEERSRLYGKMKQAFVKMWSESKKQRKSGKVSGDDVRKQMEQVLLKSWIDVPDRDKESESLRLAISQDKIVSLVEKAHNIFGVLASRTSLRDEEEELVITVKRKRSGNTPSYKVISCSFPGEKQSSGAHDEGSGHQGSRISSSPHKGDDEASQEEEDEQMEGISQRVAEYLAQIRSSMEDPE